VRTNILSLFLLFQWQSLAAETRLQIVTPYPQQGSMIVAKLFGDGEVYFGTKKLKKTKQGYVVFGVGRNAAKQVYLTVKMDRSREQKIPVSITARHWQVERIDGLPSAKVSPKSDRVLARIKREVKLVRDARNKHSDLPYFAKQFIMPAEGRISGVYGSQRILNGESKRPHFGLDIANKEGTPVFAPAGGLVSLGHPDMFYSGGTLIIDHGFGISSSYIHLNSIDVKVGQKVFQGQQIGTIGSTGRATGPHLDWRLNWFQTRLDPQLLVIPLN